MMYDAIPPATASNHARGDRLMPLANRIGTLGIRPGSPWKLLLERRLAFCFCLVLAQLLVAGWAAASASEVKRSEPGSLRSFPSQVVLRGPDSVQQLAVDGLASDETFDVSGDVQFASADPGVAMVDRSGTIVAQGDGATTIAVRRGKLEIKVPVSVKDFAASLPVNFANQVLPIFTKQGCNAG